MLSAATAIPRQSQHPIQVPIDDASDGIAASTHHPRNQRMEGCASEIFQHARHCRSAKTLVELGVILDDITELAQLCMGVEV